MVRLRLGLVRFEVVFDDLKADSLSGLTISRLRLIDRCCLTIIASLSVNVKRVDQFDPTTEKKQNIEHRERGIMTSHSHSFKSKALF